MDTLVVTQLASSVSCEWLSRTPAATHSRRPPRGKCGRGARKQIGAESAVLLYSQVALALLLCWLGGDRLSWRWPFRREHVLGRFGCFGVAGWLSCILPVFHATKWVCAVP